MITNRCKICGGGFGLSLVASERLFGFGGEFRYQQCESCECLQQTEILRDIDSHYPETYYSFRVKSSSSRLKALRRSIKRRMILKHPSLLTPLLRLWLRKQTIYWTYRRAGLVVGAKFLDVGSGSGEHVFELRGAGIDALGVDPNIPSDVIDKGSLVVEKTELGGLSGEFDLIAFNHSLEHMEDPVLPLSLAGEKLSERGKILVRIPTVSSEAFETYKEFWCQLDAPRHIFLHSHKSLEICAARASLKIEEIWCDSSEDQFAVSELFKNGESLLGPNGERRLSTHEICSSDDLAIFKRRTKHANSILKGDQICAILTRL